MTFLHHIWAGWSENWTRRWSMTPEQADLVAKIKFPCC